MGIRLIGAPNQAENPDAAQAPTERPPVPWSAYRGAAIAGAIAFVVAFILAALLIAFPAGVVCGMMTGGSPSIAEREMVRYAVAACCTLIGMLFAVLAARRQFRRRAA